MVDGNVLPSIESFPGYGCGGQLCFVQHHGEFPERHFADEEDAVVPMDFISFKVESFSSSNTGNFLNDISRTRKTRLS